MHKCSTSDGRSISCGCARGEDHDESQFDVPVEEDDVETPPE